LQSQERQSDANTAIVINYGDMLFLTLRNLKHELVRALKPFLSKTYSVYSMGRVYGLKPATKYFLTYMFDLELQKGLNRETVKRLAWISQLAMKGLFKIEKDRVIVGTDSESRRYNLFELATSKELFHNVITLGSFGYYLSELKRLGGVCTEIRDAYLCSYRGLKFVIRKYIAPDIYAGPLLHVYREPYEFKVFTNVMRAFKEPTMVDVGSYVGAYTLEGCKMHAHVLALEPDPDNFNVLRKNVELNNCTERIRLLNVAAASVQGRLPLYKGSGADTSSIQKEFPYVIPSIENYVNADTLDNILHCEGWIPGSYIDYLKIDVEGAEVDVLRSATETLQRTRYIQVEVRKDNIREVSSMLKKHGFKELIAVEYGDYKNIIFRKV